jgi:integrase
VSINTRSIDAAKPGEIIRDSTITGLQLRVLAKRKTFYLYYRTKAGVERRPKIGDFPIISLQQARDIARSMLLAVASGGDPAKERETARATPTVAELCKRYLADYAPRKKSAKEDARLIDKFVRPKLGRLKVAAVEFEDVYQLHKKLAPTPYQANRVAALLSKMFNLAERWKMRPQNSNPCRHLERYREARRRRKMNAAEAAAIAAAMKRYEATRPVSVAFLHLLILSGARKSEIARARPEWIEGSTLWLPDSKTGPKPVHLPPQAMAIIKGLPKTEDGTLLGIADPSNLWKLVRFEAGCPDLRMHDLRRTFASAALSLGYSLAQVGELLGHASTQTTAGYAYLMEEPAQLAAEAIASKLEEMMKIEAQGDQQCESV